MNILTLLVLYIPVLLALGLIYWLEKSYPAALIRKPLSTTQGKLQVGLYILVLVVCVIIYVFAGQVGYLTNPNSANIISLLVLISVVVLAIAKFRKK